MTREPTPRDLDVLRAYLDCGSIKAAAGRLGMSERAAKSHLASLRRRTGARTTAEAVYLLYPRIAA